MSSVPMAAAAGNFPKHFSYLGIREEAPLIFPRLGGRLAFLDRVHHVRLRQLTQGHQVRTRPGGGDDLCWGGRGDRK